MPAWLLEILRSIPDRRRAEGKRFDLATVLLYSILGMVAGANSYRGCDRSQRLEQRGITLKLITDQLKLLNEQADLAKKALTSISKTSLAGADGRWRLCA
jgi:DDE family transposase